MTYADCLRFARESLKRGGLEAYDFEAFQLMRYCFGLDRGRLLMLADERADEKKTELLKELLERRLSGTPLQYILGEWDFYGLSFKVGEGVLIPRPETELLCETALDFLEKRDFGGRTPVVFDLCAGSGCIGLSIAKLYKGGQSELSVFEFEKSKEAFAYLSENKRRLRTDNAVLKRCDILEGPPLGSLRADLIVSNPPYIKSSELDSLQEEVRREPREALDGGEDGLCFYRAIAEKWLCTLRPGGLALFECAEGQAEKLCALLEEKGGKSFIRRDFAGIDRLCGAFF